MDDSYGLLPQGYGASRTSMSEGGGSMAQAQPHLAPVNPHQHVHYSHSDPGMHFYSAFQSLRPSLHPIMPFGANPKNLSSGNYAIPHQIPPQNYFPPNGYHNSNDYDEAEGDTDNEYDPQDAEGMRAQMNSLNLSGSRGPGSPRNLQPQKSPRPQSPKFNPNRQQQSGAMGQQPPPQFVGGYQQHLGPNDFQPGYSNFASNGTAFVGNSSKSSPSVLGQHPAHYANGNAQHLNMSQYSAMPVHSFNAMPSYSAMPLGPNSPPLAGEDSPEEYEREIEHDVIPENALIANSFGFGSPFDVVRLSISDFFF